MYFAEETWVWIAYVQRLSRSRLLDSATLRYLLTAAGDKKVDEEKATRLDGRRSWGGISTPRTNEEKIDRSTSS